MSGPKVLLVTAASSNVGGALINDVAKDYDVILAHYNNSIGSIGKLQESFGKKVIPLKADFLDLSSVGKMIEQINDLNLRPTCIVHLAAGKYSIQRFSKETVENFDAAFKISVLSIMKILQAFLPCMAKEKFGKIVFMLSDVTLNMPPKQQTCYTTIKYALLGFMKSLAVDYADKGVCINAVSPDMMETNFLNNIPRLIVEQNASKNPIGRNLVPADVVGAFSFLLSDKSDCVRGINLPVTGAIA